MPNKHQHKKLFLFRKSYLKKEKQSPDKKMPFQSK